ncbi:hypothetical protein Y032_0005g2650 [Ancylostoma ceylanicum]|nr:hypothetical protein Y032_0005g2650 [Ancylostoma ceylanicum]
MKTVFFVVVAVFCLCHIPVSCAPFDEPCDQACRLMFYQYDPKREENMPAFRKYLMDKCQQHFRREEYRETREACPRGINAVLGVFAELGMKNKFKDREDFQNHLDDIDYYHHLHDLFFDSCRRRCPR